EKPGSPAPYSAVTPWSRPAWSSPPAATFLLLVRPQYPAAVDDKNSTLRGRITSFSAPDSATSFSRQLDWALFPAVRCSFLYRLLLAGRCRHHLVRKLQLWTREPPPRSRDGTVL